MASARAAATYDDILALPEGIRGEIIFGVLETQSQPRPLHQEAASQLGWLLTGPFRAGLGGPGGWRILGALKMDAYAEIGVEHLWIVDADLRALEVFRCDGARWTRLAAFADDAAIRAEPFDAVELDFGALWRPPARHS